MDDQAGSARQPPRRRRRRPRPEGRWTNPATTLQAVRFERRLSGREVVRAIRSICPGHSGEPCKLDVAKLSDYETGNRRPGLLHIEAFCRFYQLSPERLGLIKWRDHNDDHDQPGEGGDGAKGLPEEASLEALLSGSLHTATTVLAGVSTGELRLGEDVTVDRVLLDLIAGTVALTAAATQVLRALDNQSGGGTSAAAAETIV